MPHWLSSLAYLLSDPGETLSQKARWVAPDEETEVLWQPHIATYVYKPSIHTHTDYIKVKKFGRDDMGDHRLPASCPVFLLNGG